MGSIWGPLGFHLGLSRGLGGHSTPCGFRGLLGGKGVRAGGTSRAGSRDGPRGCRGDEYRAVSSGPGVFCVDFCFLWLGGGSCPLKPTKTNPAIIFPSPSKGAVPHQNSTNNPYMARWMVMDIHRYLYSKCDGYMRGLGGSRNRKH